MNNFLLRTFSIGVGKARFLMTQNELRKKEPKSPLVLTFNK